MVPSINIPMTPMLLLEDVVLRLVLPTAMPTVALVPQLFLALSAPAELVAIGTRAFVPLRSDLSGIIPTPHLLKLVPVENENVDIPKALIPETPSPLGLATAIIGIVALSATPVAIAVALPFMLL